MKRHVVLVGLPGSGKSTVGRLAAGLLGAPFLDLDDEIERVAGQSVREIFEVRGEAGFRELERGAMRRALCAEPAIVAPGGGWAAQPGAMEEARELAFIMYLSVPAEVAAARCAMDGQESTVNRRPLTVDQPLALLMKAREPYYLQADVVVSNAADDASRVARLVSDLARRHAGW
ncbi:MAG TPA: shikimate kinase [Gemmatimonadales bacterium]|nr:shikimate kinase [Gemmatimonadales bacterium]